MRAWPAAHSAVCESGTQQSSWCAASARSCCAPCRPAAERMHDQARGRRRSEAGRCSQAGVRVRARAFGCERGPPLRQGRPALVYGDVVYLRFADALGAEFATAVVATEQARARRACGRRMRCRSCRNTPCGAAAAAGCACPRAGGTRQGRTLSVGVMGPLACDDDAWARVRARPPACWRRRPRFGSASRWPPRPAAATQAPGTGRRCQRGPAKGTQERRAGEARAVARACWRTCASASTARPCGACMRRWRRPRRAARTRSGCCPCAARWRALGTVGTSKRSRCLLGGAGAPALARPRPPSAHLRARGA